MMLTYFCCHLLGMSSACTNPFIYAFLNESFAAELRWLGIRFMRKLLRCWSTHKVFF
jgi:prolactin releasing hormone receptor